VRVVFESSMRFRRASTIRARRGRDRRPRLKTAGPLGGPACGVRGNADSDEAPAKCVRDMVRISDARMIEHEPRFVRAARSAGIVHRPARGRSWRPATMIELDIREAACISW